MSYRFVPIVTWPGKPTPVGNRRRSTFSASHRRTLDDLERELAHLGARQVVIQTHHEERDLRLDGLPRAGAREPDSPGVILTFTTSAGTFSYPCDTFTSWKANLRAIVLTLEHLRAIDRYGVTKHGEQYRGWKQIPPASTSTAAAMTPEDAAEFISRHAGGENGRRYYTPADVLKLTSVRDVAYRIAARRLHPDAGGDHEAFVRLQEAVAVLRSHPV